jgi:DnaJ-domain-containing protein 1
MIDENQIPVLGSTAGLEKLNLTPEEFFVLSRINGSMTVKKISQMIGFTAEKTQEVLQKLHDNHVIIFKNSAKKDEPKKKIDSKNQPILQVLDEEDKDPVLSQIPRSFRNRILLISQDLDNANFFEILEVTPSSNADEIQKNYLRLVKEFHPDSFRAQEAGYYKQKVEKIFGKIQEGYQEIHSDAKRAAYLHHLMENRRTLKDVHKTSKSKYEYKIPQKKIEVKFADADSQHDMGLKEEKKGNLQAALNFYQMAVNLNPQRKEFEEAFFRVRKLIREGF